MEDDFLHLQQTRTPDPLSIDSRVRKTTSRWVGASFEKLLVGTFAKKNPVLLKQKEDHVLRCFLYNFQCCVVNTTFAFTNKHRLTTRFVFFLQVLRYSGGVDPSEVGGSLARKGGESNDQIFSF